MREFSFRAIFVGVVVGALLAAANAFVGLKVGLVISASIPAAVIGMLVMRKVFKTGTLLESNMVQTVGSAGESVAAGMIFTIPALFIMGEDPIYWSMVIWGAIGGLLGVCFMVPLRQVLIVKEHGVLPYPEGVACAEVLESGERGGTGARSVILGGIVGAVYYLFGALGIWKETGTISLRSLRTEAQLDSSPALLGVGYILGIRVAGYMLAGAFLSWFVLIPAIAFFGADATTAIFPSKELISSMEPMALWKNYIKYIGAGAVTVGGLISLIKSFPTIGSSLWRMLSGMFGGRQGKLRTEKDFPLLLLALIIGGLGYAMWRLEAVRLDHIGVVAVLIFTFFFVTVSSRLVGIVGCSSNPISGMTIATLLATAMVYKIFVLDRAADPSTVDTMALKVTCMSVCAIVCVAIATAGDCSQDLKTGFLVKATPYKQQVGEMIGVLTAVLAIAAVIQLLANTYGFGDATAEHPNALLAPQAGIMKVLVDGVIGGQVPWTLIFIGGATAIVVEMLGLSALPFAVGMYLPLGLSTPIMVGGLIAWLVQRKQKTKTEHDPGVLTSAGLVAGMGLAGVTLAGVAALISWLWDSPTWIDPNAVGGAVGRADAVTPVHLMPWVWSRIEAVPLHWGLTDAWWSALPMIPFAGLAAWLWLRARKRPAIELPPTPVEPIEPIEPVGPSPDADATPLAPADDEPPPSDAGEPSDVAGSSAPPAPPATKPPATTPDRSAPLAGTMGSAGAATVDELSTKFSAPEAIEVVPEAIEVVPEPIETQPESIESPPELPEVSPDADESPGDSETVAKTTAPEPVSEEPVEEEKLDHSGALDRLMASFPSLHAESDEEERGPDEPPEQNDGTEPNDPKDDPKDDPNDQPTP